MYFKVSSITEFDFEVAWNATKDLVERTVPILQTEGEAIKSAAEQVPEYVASVFNVSQMRRTECKTHI
jgi:hypothetical protein